MTKERKLSRRHAQMTWDRWVSRVKADIKEDRGYNQIQCGYCLDGRIRNSSRRGGCSGCIINPNLCNASATASYTSWNYQSDYSDRRYYSRLILAGIARDLRKWGYMTTHREKILKELLGK